jgi:uridylate kinase
MQMGVLVRRILLKLSGEALAGEQKTGFDDAIVRAVALQVKEVRALGIEVGVVIGGGNFWRGRSSNVIDRTKADQIGMLATIMNCIYVSEVFRSVGMETTILTPFECGTLTKLFSKDRTNRNFVKGSVVFFAGGTGHPYFSTDTAVVLRAVEMEADMILLAKAVDGVYDDDPSKNPNATKYHTVSIDEVIAKNLQVVDMTATVLAKENGMPMRVFALDAQSSIVDAVCGEFRGTEVTVQRNM